MSESIPASTILVVDDEPGIIQLCLSQLEQAGFHVRATADPAEGLKILDSEQIDLFLVDIRMPETGGFELVDRAHQRKPDLAVVIMTGHTTVETAIEALSRGADGLVLKPFAGSELVQSVRHALDESRHKQDILRLQTLRPLFDVTETLFAETNPARLQALLLETVRGYLRCPIAGLYIWETAHPTFRLVVGRGNLDNLIQEGDPEHSIVGRSALWNMPIRVNRDGTGDPALQSLLSARGLISLMAVPINISSGYSTQPEDRNILVAARPSGETPFSESDLEFFAILARQAGVALENAHLQSALRDYIHQVEESQRALILAEKMAIAGRLTASIAHEINNPLQSLQNCLHLASRSELSIEDRQGYLDLAHAELDRLMNTVQRMLDYYRPAAVDRQPIEINDLINRVLTLLDQQLRDHAIQLQVHLAAKLPEIWVVADQIQQVLLNLILNAMEAMPEGGNLYIYTRVYKDGIEIIVEDTGPGIDKNQRKRIFDPFFSTKERGTGLGLAISFGIVVAHGGSLDIIPGRGKGACFRMILPSREYA